MMHLHLEHLKKRASSLSNSYLGTQIQVGTERCRCGDFGERNARYREDCIQPAGAFLLFRVGSIPKLGTRGASSVASARALPGAAEGLFRF